MIEDDDRPTGGNDPTIVDGERLATGTEAVLRRDALGIVESTLRAVRPERLLEGVLCRRGEEVIVGDRRYDLSTVEDVYVLGSGKGSVALVEGVLDRLGGTVTRALAVEKRGGHDGAERTRGDEASTGSEPPEGPASGTDRPELTVLEADHPVPTAASRAAAAAVLELAREAGPADLVIVPITGGTSALLAAPEGVSLEELAATTEALLAAGAPVEELNAVRKHLSRIKGGRLVREIAPARTVGLIVVDEVAGEPWGPTVPDPTTYGTATAALDRHGLAEAVPESVADRLAAGVRGELPETPTRLDADIHNVVLATAATLCSAAADAAAERGYRPLVLSTTIEGESREVGVVHGGIAREARERGRPAEPPCVLVSGGETTVTVTGDGVGGPNQETALGFARTVDGLDGVVGAFLDTDGTDGPTDVAGAVVDGSTAGRCRECGLDIPAALEENDATSLLEALGDAVRLDGPSTNLMDLRLVVVDDGR